MKSATGVFKNVCIVCGATGLGVLAVVTAGVLVWVALI